MSRVLDGKRKATIRSGNSAVSQVLPVIPDALRIIASNSPQSQNVPEARVPRDNSSSAGYYFIGIWRRRPALAPAVERRFVECHLGAVKSGLGAANCDLGAVEPGSGCVESRKSRVESRFGRVESDSGAVEADLGRV